MKKSIAIAAIALATAGATHAQTQAASPWSAEIGYTALSVKAGGDKLKPSAIRAFVGYDVNANLAIEGMLAFGLSDDSVSGTTILGPTTASVELRSAYGLFLKPKFDLNDRVQVFARVGFAESKVRLSATAPGLSGSISDSGSDLAYGLGANYRFSEKAYVGADYMNYYSKDGVKLNGITVSIGTRF